MNLEHLALAKQELSTILLEGLIEPTASSWACEAFYVNKHAKQIQGKLILVINYHNLNHFLADDKFPLPKKSALFQHLSNAKCFQNLILKQDFGSLESTQKKGIREHFAFQITITNGQSCPLASKMPYPNSKKQC